jgi:hypothetical protein
MLNNIIEIYKFNNIYFKIICEPNQSLELNEYLKVDIINKFFNPLVRAHKWDGKISFFDIRNNFLAIGLLPYFDSFCKKFNYTYHLNVDKNEFFNDIPIEKIMEFANNTLQPIYLDEIKSGKRKFQIECVQKALENKRGIIVVGTGGGKSCSIYLIIRYLLSLEKKCLIVVPSTFLVEQLFNDFKDYSNGWMKDKVNILYSGKDYDENKPVLLSTYQTLSRKDEKFFERFGALCIDECIKKDSLITMADGTTKQIKDLQIGEKILTINEKNVKETKENIILKIYKNLNREDKYEIKLENGKKLTITGNHIIYTKRGKIRIDKLNMKDEILTNE